MWMWLVVALGNPLAPMVVVDWAGHEGQLEVWPAMGAEVSEEAPVTLDLAWGDKSVRWETLGEALETGLSVGDVRGQSLNGHLQLSLCEKASGTCAVRDFALEGYTEDRRRGRAVLAVSEAEPLEAAPEPEHPAHAPEFQTDAEAVANAAFEASAEDGRRVLLDFGAVWCPPCNLLAAQVLHADPSPEELDQVHVAAIDVDDPRSFALKSQYEVGGYPTIVLAEADGTEISRLVGYPGKADFLDWLAEAAAQEGPDDDPAALDPASVSPERAAELAWEAVQNDGDPGPWLERGAEAVSTKELHLARVSVEPTLDDAKWLALNAPGTALQWVYPALALAETDEGREVLRSALEADLAAVGGTEASDMLYLLGEVVAEPDKRLMYAASAAALRAAFAGDADQDRGHYTWLAVLVERSGDVDGAVAFLEEQAKRFPEEPTFYLSLASMQLRNERPGQSLVAAEAAMAASWGDNKLRSAEAACKALAALDRDDEAVALAKKTLEEIPAPDEALKVRTHKYRARLQAWVDGTVGDKEK